jgi:hypothetical protein
MLPHSVFIHLSLAHSPYQLPILSVSVFLTSVYFNCIPLFSCSFFFYNIKLFYYLSSSSSSSHCKNFYAVVHLYVVIAEAERGSGRQTECSSVQHRDGTTQVCDIWQCRSCAIPATCVWRAGNNMQSRLVIICLYSFCTMKTVRYMMSSLKIMITIHLLFIICEYYSFRFLKEQNYEILLPF